ncbi:MAG: hypothetical protein V3R98_06740, partial [Alphaproteobacteria bacterium]
MKPITPFQSKLSAHHLLERKEVVAANGNTSVRRDEYRLDVAHCLPEFAPFLECWNANRHYADLPTLKDFDGLRHSSSIAGIHLVDVACADPGEFVYLQFDSSTRLDDRDMTGTYVAEYPDAALSNSGLVDYQTAATLRRCTFMEVSVKADRTSRKFARLILPLREGRGRHATKLLVV